MPREPDHEPHECLRGATRPLEVEQDEPPARSQRGRCGRDHQSYSGGSVRAKVEITPPALVQTEGPVHGLRQHLSTGIRETSAHLPHEYRERQHHKANEDRGHGQEPDQRPWLNDSFLDSSSLLASARPSRPISGVDPATPELGPPHPGPFKALREVDGDSASYAAAIPSSENITSAS
jgi:hypothetical protein